MKNPSKLIGSVLLVLLPALPSASGQTLDWVNRLVFYGDNTEWSTPYRDGETIFGTYLETFFSLRWSDQGEVQLGLFGDYEYGDEEVVDPVLPLVSFRYRVGRSRFVLGTLETQHRHGLLDPFQVSTLELRRPVETGLQWLHAGDRLQADLFINWQKLNTPAHREAFDYGGSVDVQLHPRWALNGQLHGYHEGGQLYSVGRVFNNFAFGAGATLTFEPVSLQALWLESRTTADPAHLDRPEKGSGLLARLGYQATEATEVFAIGFRGDDFVAWEGDPNYGSQTLEDAAYEASREYYELGVRHERELLPDVWLAGEVRLHLIDDEPGYSYRFLVRVPVQIPIDLPVRPGAGQ